MALLVSALGPLLARVLLAAIFCYSGLQKLTAPGRAAASIAGHGLPFASALAYAAGGVELVLAALLALGLKARLAALAAVLYLLVVTALYHWSPAVRGDHGQMIHLLKNAGLVGGLLLLACHGAGTASVDRN